MKENCDKEFGVIVKKILFLIHDLGGGGAENVLVNLVNHMDHKRFDISVTALFGGGINEKKLDANIHYHAIFPKMIPGNKYWQKLLSPVQLHNMIIKDHYDIEVAYLEGTCARIISGCRDPKTGLLAWIHVVQYNREKASGSFRSYEESRQCYKRFDQIICVSESVKQDFLNIYSDIKNIDVLYNTIDTEKIRTMKDKPVENHIFRKNEFNIIAMGRMCPQKGFDRLARIVKRLRDKNYPVNLYALGSGHLQRKLEAYTKELDIQDCFTFLGYQTNPYKFVSKCDLFVCASLAEGFSTAAAESLIVGTPVCTVDVAGMKEMLGNKNEWGIVTENNENALCQKIEELILNPDILLYYRKQAEIRGKMFSTNETVKAVENKLLSIIY